MDELRFELDCDTTCPHFHDELEILYILSGRIAVLSSGTNFVLKAEDFVVFNPYENHGLYKEIGTHTLSLFVPRIILDQAGLGRVLCRSSLQEEQEEYLRLLRTRLALLFKNYQEYIPNRKPQILSILFGLLAVLKEQFENTVPDQEDNRPTDSERIQELLTYTAEHFTEDISVQSVADEFYLSRSHLSRIFQKAMGMPFSDYVRKLRMRKVLYLLHSSTLSITDIAYECGFSNVNTMILNFRQEYGKTPGSYRENMEMNVRKEEEENQEVEISFMHLMKYAAYEEISRPLNKKQDKAERLKINIRKGNTPIHFCHRELIFGGWAQALLLESVRNAVRRAVREIGFRFISFHGILNEAVDVYHETDSGEVWLNYTYIDMILDFILETGAKPWMEFGYTPLKMVSGKKDIYGEACVNMPDDLNKWSFLVESLMRHFADRYGVEEIESWHYITPHGLYVSLGIYDLNQFFEFYQTTFLAIRKVLPQAHIIGGAFDTGHCELDNGEQCKKFMIFCEEHACIPDEFGIQCLQSDYSQRPLAEIGARIFSTDGQQTEEPTGVSSDPDALKNGIAMTRRILNEVGFQGLPICVGAWGSTTWQGELGTDTCFSSAFLMKGLLENAGTVCAINHSLTDNSERKVLNSRVYHGGFGLMTYQGLPKAGYHVYTLLNQLDPILVGRGEGYMVTKSKDGKRVQICLYHYCHYNMETHISQYLSEEALGTVDRYYGFENKGIKAFHFHLSGLNGGTYRKESYVINREHGSSYDIWMGMGAPEKLSRKQLEYLERCSAPRYQYERIYVEEDGELLVSAVLDEHEVRLISIRRD